MYIEEEVLFLVLAISHQIVLQTNFVNLAVK